MVSYALVLAGSSAVYGAYLWWRLSLLHKAVRRCSACGPRWLARIAATGATKYAAFWGVELISEGGEGLKAESKQYMYVWHPHGFISFVPSFIMGGKAVAGEPHGRPWFGTCIGLLFKIPVLGEVFQLTNARPVDRRSLDSILSQGGSIALQPGGVKEQAATRHDQEQAFFPAKLGFIRMAIKYGLPLMPLYIFGENQLYRRVGGFDWLTKIIRKMTGMTLPIVRARFGLPMAGLMPLRTAIHIRWGNAIDVGLPEAEPSEERIQEVFARYKAELQRLFDANAKECLPLDLAEKGLQIVKLEDRSVQSSETSKKK
mmetsp:Transcript_15631/g.33239  ORF Transcript_15631/g.33239 Transcript_15631/m.33239 type:complete len:315 (-) Transcript_15631:111-1055(-)